MMRLFQTAGYASLLAGGAIFGFFYAWVCSTMWGLDATAPEIAIGAMHAMNASVRNPTFALSFFGTPVILIITAVLGLVVGQRRAAVLFGAAALVYLVGAFGVTLAINVPMNEALATVTIPDTRAAATQVWTDYSDPWKFWNTLRTVVSGVSLLLIGAALRSITPTAR